MPAFDLRHGDSLALLPALPPASMDACVADPPYELGFMGQAWDRSGIANSVELWRGVLRALKPGAHLLAFGGTRTYHRMACAIEDAGFEIRDQIGWLYGSGFPKSANLDGAWAGWGTGLKPAWEPIVLARKPLGQKTVAANVARHGTGALHIDATRIPAGEGDYDQAGSAAPSGTGSCYGAMPNKVTRADPSALGRWPANVIHDGSPEVLAAFAAFGERISGSAGQVIAKHGFTGFGGGGTGATTYGIADSGGGSAARFYYCAKASAEDREAGMQAAGLVERRLAQAYRSIQDGRNAAGTEAPRTPRANYHPTVKPTDLMRYLVRMVTPAGGTVLDPFTGSGSTGRGAVLEGCNFVGLEQDAAYVEIARARIADAVGPLFC